MVALIEHGDLNAIIPSIMAATPTTVKAILVRFIAILFVRIKAKTYATFLSLGRYLFYCGAMIREAVKVHGAPGTVVQ